MLISCIGKSWARSNERVMYFLFAVILHVCIELKNARNTLWCKKVNFDCIDGTNMRTPQIDVLSFMTNNLTLKCEYNEQVRKAHQIARSYDIFLLFQ